MRWIYGLLLFSGCVANNSLQTWAESQQNVDNIMRISSGMSAEEVIHIMHKPYRIETYQIGQDSFEVWFYITRETVPGQSSPLHTNLTPLVLKDGILLGRGFDYYRWLLRKKESYVEIEKEKNGRENLDIEKTLDVTPPTPPSPKPNPEPKKEKIPFTPEDENQMEEEQEQNFNYW